MSMCISDQPEISHLDLYHRERFLFLHHDICKRMFSAILKIAKKIRMMQISIAKKIVNSVIFRK